MNLTQAVTDIINYLKEKLLIKNTAFLETFSVYFYLLNCQKENPKKALSTTKKIKKYAISNNNIDLKEIKNTYKEIKDYINRLIMRPVLL